MGSDIEHILLKDYEVMRTEVRMYIGKFYIALSVIYGVLSAGIFKIGSETTHFTSILIPFVTAGLVGFMSMVTFFVNKTAGHVRLIEDRIARIHGGEVPEIGSLPKTGATLAPLIWESLYADLLMGRDTGRRMNSLYCLTLLVMGVPAALILAVIVVDGYGVVRSALTDNPIFLSGYRLLPEWWAAIYVFLSIFVVSLSGFIFYRVNDGVRRFVGQINKQILRDYPEESTKNRLKVGKNGTREDDDDDGGDLSGSM